MRGNNSGTKVTVKGSLKTFDKLPKHIREKLARANHNWSPEECEDFLLWEGATALSEHITEAEQAMAAAHYAVLASGKPYPK